MNLHDKFARVAALRPSRTREPLPERSTIVANDEDRLARVLGAQVQRNCYGQYLSVKRWYDKPEMCAPTRRSLSLLMPQGSDGGKHPGQVIEKALDPERWLFLDTETTGLAGGTGTYAFLVGIAWWDAGGLQVEQFCMRDLDEEHSLLLELSERILERPVLVTFNGKSFDWPLLETRYRMTRKISAGPLALHLDLLHPARHLWRLRLGSVRLKELEAHVLGGEGSALGWSRDDDIDSSLIPQMYFDYLRGGPAEPLAGVFRHNQMDLRGLAALAGKMIGMLDPDAKSDNQSVNFSGSAPASPSSEHPLDLYGLSRLLHRRGEKSRARAVCETALLGGLPDDIRRLAQRDLALLAKRERDYACATALWESMCESVQPDSRKKESPGFPKNNANDALDASLETAIEAAEQLAMYYEHHAKHQVRAAELTQRAIVQLRSAQHQGTITAARSKKIEDRLQRRLDRLKRLQKKCARLSF
jgi:uncharacterized protein YprB with RNaseH-like and TPR domain